MSRLPIIICGRTPGQFSKDDVLGFLKRGVSLAFSGYGEAGYPFYSSKFLELLKDFPDMPHIMPIKVGSADAGSNESAWLQIFDSWRECGPPNPIIYAVDEPMNRHLHNCPFNPYTERAEWMQWKREQLIIAQKTIDDFVTMFPHCRPLITSDKPVPPGAMVVDKPGLIRAYCFQHIQMAMDWFGDDWREPFGIHSADIVWGYLGKPLFGQGWNGREIGEFVKAAGLQGFLYYTVNEDIWDGRSITPEFRELWRAMG